MTATATNLSDWSNPPRLEDVDLTDPNLFVHGDPKAVFARMRREAPVYWHERKPGQGFWCVARYDDAIRVYRDAGGFSSANGAALDFAGRTTGGAKAMLYTDPPLHGQIRGLVSARFVRRALEAVVPKIHSTAAWIVDGVIDRGECEFVYDVAAKMPANILCDMLDIPDADRPFILGIGDRILGSTDPEIAKGRSAAEVADEAREAFRDYCRVLIEERRRRPGDDILSDLIHGQVDGRETSEVEITANMLNLVIAGQETTRNTAAGGLLLMIQDPAIRTFFEDGQTCPTAIEEVLRFLSPGLHAKREATRDVELGGQRIRAGDKVVMWNISANNDEAQFTDPQRFDPLRDPNPHLAFGFGPHVCLGAFLARLELKILYEHILPRMHQFELAGPVERLQSILVYGLKRMPVRFARR